MTEPPGAPPATLVELGWDDRVAGRWAPHEGAGWQPGRVIRTSRHFTYVGTANGLVQAEAPADLEPAPVAGDWVGLDVGGPDDTARVAVVLPRWSELSRRDPSGRSDRQVLAADVDLVLIVAGLDRPVKPGRIERSLVLAWDSGAEPVIVLTKADAVDGSAAVVAEVAAVAGDVPVHVLSARTGEGTAEVHALLAGPRTAVLLGESGAGKSTLVNRLAAQEVQRTAEVRGGDAKGRHTTVTRDLIVLPTGGVIIDTPGLRGLGLLDADEGLAATFADIEDLAEGCQFRDCGHGAEPGCAVRAAVDDGELDETRLERYLGMQAELDEGAAAQVAADRKRDGRRASRTMRRYRQDDPKGQDRPRGR